MIQDALTFSTCFNLDGSPKNFILTDSTDYVGEGIALADVKVVFEIQKPSGGFAYQNVNFANPDLDYSSDPFPGVFIDANLPFTTGATPVVETGTYLVQMTVEVGGAVQAGTYIFYQTYDYCHVTPEVCLLVMHDCRCSTMSSSDDTSYSIYLTTITRTHELRPPPGVDAVVTGFTGSTEDIQTTPISDNTWSALLTSVTEYTYPDGLLVKETITGVEEQKVVCDLNFCDILCCIKGQRTRLDDALSSNPSRAKIEQTKYDRVIADMVEFTTAITCGDDDYAQILYDDILTTSNCTKGCGCDSENPITIIPFCGPAGGGSGTVTVTVCGNGAIVLDVQEGSGDDVNYELCFDQDLLDRLNLLVNTTLTAGPNITITPTVDPVTGDIDYEVEAGVTGGAVQMMSFVYRVDFSNKVIAVLPPEEVEFVRNYGSTFQAVAGFEDQFVERADINSWKKVNNCQLAQGFYVGSPAGGEKYKADIGILEFIPTGPSSPVCDRVRLYDVEIIEYGAEEFHWRFVNLDGTPVTNETLFNAFDSISVQITLIA